MAGTSVVEVPPASAARVWLDAVAEEPCVPSQVRSAQRVDGSWGSSDDVRRRVLPTLWTVSTLADLGCAGDEVWDGGVGFLSRCASTDDGVFSRDGTPAGVLACYVAIAARTYLAGGRRDLAAPQVGWVLRYQDVRVRGVSLRGGVPVYHPALAVRYGGCLASTTCLIGVVKAGRALELWRRTAGDGRGGDAVACDELLGVVREVLLERRLMFTGGGELLPLGTAPVRAAEWLVPSFPLDWRTDLVEVLDLVARTGAADVRMQPALDHLASVELPGGGWPLLRGFWPSGFPVLEARTGRRPSRLVTGRVLGALDAIGGVDGRR